MFIRGERESRDEIEKRCCILGGVEPNEDPTRHAFADPFPDGGGESCLFAIPDDRHVFPKPPFAILDVPDGDGFGDASGVLSFLVVSVTSSSLDLFLFPGLELLLSYAGSWSPS